MGRNGLENLALAVSSVALLTTGCRVSLQLSPTTSAVRTVNQEQPPPSVSPQRAIINSLIKSLNQNRERGEFNNKIGVVTLPKAVMIGSAGGQRPVIDTYNLPDENIGHRLTRPILDLSEKPIGPYKYFLRVINPTTGKIMFWAVHLNPKTYDYNYFTAGEFPNGWHSNFFYENGREVDGDELFKPFLPLQEQFSQYPIVGE